MLREKNQIIISIHRRVLILLRKNMQNMNNMCKYAWKTLKVYLHQVSSCLSA